MQCHRPSDSASERKEIGLGELAQTEPVRRSALKRPGYSLPQTGFFPTLRFISVHGDLHVHITCVEGAVITGLTECYRAYDCESFFVPNGGKCPLAPVGVKCPAGHVEKYDLFTSCLCTRQVSFCFRQGQLG